ncbi:MAG TPA: L,D-transpeptidase [Gemmatimonadaceae bacterium]|nr:L,D-transpeptidase [Gemmatimonadaceae bacterium]
MLSRIATLGAAAAIFTGPASLLAQGPTGQNDLSARTRTAVDSVDVSDDAVPVPVHTYSFKSRSDSLSWARHKAVAARAKGFHLVVSLQDRHIWAITDDDTLLSAPAAVASGKTLEFGSQEWTFDMPRGIRHVLGKEADPIWQPPEWLYAETAKENGLKLAHLYNGHPIKLDDGRILTMKDGEAGLIEDGQFAALPRDEHIVFGSTLYVPPMGSKNRRVHGELGKYRLMLGEGFLMHGTPDKDSIGLAATHGCVRLRDDDIQWLYENVPVGTPVYIY